MMNFKKKRQHLDVSEKYVNAFKWTKSITSKIKYMYFHIDSVKLLYEVICIFSYLLLQNILHKVQS